MQSGLRGMNSVNGRGRGVPSAHYRREVTPNEPKYSKLPRPECLPGMLPSPAARPHRAVNSFDRRSGLEVC